MSVSPKSHSVFECTATEAPTSRAVTTAGCPSAPRSGTVAGGADEAATCGEQRDANDRASPMHGARLPSNWKGDMRGSGIQLTLGIGGDAAARGATRALAPGAVVLAGFALADEARLLADLAVVTSAAPFRHLETPGGFRMSVAMTNCGARGWVSDRRGYRYDAVDPDSGRAWPPMPASFRALAAGAAAAGGFTSFEPDACLVNRYEPGARLTLHQDRDERDYGAPIVSVSLGLPAVFLFGGDSARRSAAARAARPTATSSCGAGPSRLRFHGVAAISDGWHETLGACRINLTFRARGLIWRGTRARGRGIMSPVKTTPKPKKVSPSTRAKVGKSAPAAQKWGTRANLGAPIDGFFARQPAELRAILEALRAEVERAAPEAAGAIKWGMPFYTLGGEMMCALGAHKAHVNLILAGPPGTFADPEGRLEGGGKTGKHLKLRTLAELPRAAVRGWLRAAAATARAKAAG